MVVVVEVALVVLVVVLPVKWGRERKAVGVVVTLLCEV
jgi:hypothetical protein